MKDNELTCRHCGVLHVPVLRLVLTGLALFGMWIGFALFQKVKRQDPGETGRSPLEEEVRLTAPLPPSLNYETTTDAALRPTTLDGAAPEADALIGYYRRAEESGTRYYWNGATWQREIRTNSGWQAEAVTLQHPKELLDTGYLQPWRGPGP
jgi:hypothetical protein